MSENKATERNWLPETVHFRMTTLEAGALMAILCDTKGRRQIANFPVMREGLDGHPIEAEMIDVLIGKLVRDLAQFYPNPKEWKP
jgi:hypothetical protein